MARAYNSDHLTSNRDYQTQLTNWYEIQIQDMSEDITLMTQSVSLPNESSQVIELPYGNTTAKVSGPVTFDSTSITVRDAITKDIEEQLREWRNKVVDLKTGKMGWVDEYKKTMIVTQYGPDGTYERTWQFEGVWPSSINFGSLDMSSSDVKTIEMTLEFDKAYRSN